jgi:hypothetical protein
MTDQPVRRAPSLWRRHVSGLMYEQNVALAPERDVHGMGAHAVASVQGAARDALRKASADD